MVFDVGAALALSTLFYVAVIALARALLRTPSLLILDEATSALDTPHEDRIYRALARLHGHLTIVVIAHRLSTIRAADTILVVAGGAVVEAGTWEALWTRADGRFRAMAQMDRQDAAPPALRADA